MPAKVTFSVNIPALTREMSEGRNRRTVERAAEPLVQDIANQAVRELAEDFESHDITREIEAGPLAGNSSGTLGGYGNLFSYIGFARGTRPTDPVRKELSKRPKVKAQFINGSFRISMVGPSIERVYDVTPLPWASDSWARRVEVGLAGFGYYLAKDSASSRSGIAIQTHHKIRGGRFRNVSYMTKMFRSFYKKLGVKL